MRRGIAAVTSKEDSFELHVRDTMEAGAGLCKRERGQDDYRGRSGKELPS